MNKQSIVILLIMIQELTMGQGLISNTAGNDSCVILKGKFKNFSGICLMECGYMKDDKIIYEDLYSLPLVYDKSLNRFPSNSDTAYVFLTNGKRFFEKYDCPNVKTIDYWEFFKKISSKKCELDSVYFKAVRKKARKNFGNSRMYFVYFKFNAVVTYFEDYKKSDSETYGYYYDFNPKTTTLLEEKVIRKRYIVDIEIL